MNRRTFVAARRSFLAGAAASAAASLLGSPAPIAAAETPGPETTRLRLTHSPSLCVAPEYLALDLLRLEGFTEIHYEPVGSRGGPEAVISKRADITMWPAPSLVPVLDAGGGPVVLAGIHSGCFELFGNDRVQSVRDLKGKTVAISYVGGGDHVMLASMLAYVGLRPEDVNWLPGPGMHDGMTYFVDGRADAYMAFTPHPQELRAMKVGHVIIDTAADRPWSQYFCCMIAANRDFASRNPRAVKCALRAILKAADICANEPEHVARYLFEQGYERRIDLTLQALQGIRYRRWREAHPEDTIRFHALRLHEVGMIKTDPNTLIRRGTDWRALDELRRELKS